MNAAVADTAPHIEGTDLYARSLLWAETNLDPDGVALHRKVWDGTPWMIDAFTGECGGDRDFSMRQWCRDELGEEAWPIHGRAGPWYRGSATVYGWTWFGFASREMMDRFMAAWPAPSDAAASAPGGSRK